MMNAFGNNYKIKIFGESHGPEIGVIIDGLPEGTKINMEALQTFLERRAPGRKDIATARFEPDLPEFRTGMEGDITTGNPIMAIIRNTNVRKQDYKKFENVPRPGHADFPAMVRGNTVVAPSGGGPYSGRMTAPLCVAGGIAIQMLEKKGIRIHGEAMKIAGKTERCEMLEEIHKAKEEGDSVGGIIRCWVENLPVGIGEPMFEGIENKISQAVFAIPAIKGIEFGRGFEMAGLRGSENNDEYFVTEGPTGKKAIRTFTNNAGGILGGMTNGMPVYFTVVVKPTPSIKKPQKSVNMATMEDTILEIEGRHDPCIVLRAVPCVEAAAAIAIYDLILEREK